jgi:hypothetical protein
LIRPRNEIDRGVFSSITLSLPKGILREAKHFAVDQGVSLSGFLVEALADRVKRLREIQRAGARLRALSRSRKSVRKSRRFSERERAIVNQQRAPAPHSFFWQPLAQL